MEQLAPLLGSELETDRLDRALHALADRQNARPAILLEVTCSDGPDPEPLPATGGGALFRITNPGARYEWGAIDLAERGLALPLAAGASRMLVVRILGHVSVRAGAAGSEFAEGHRCAALDALLNGESLPFVAELTATFRSFGRDRLMALTAAVRNVAPDRLPLLAALVGARLEARRAVLDLLDREPRTPTLYAVSCGVTLSRPGRETELFAGIYTIDRRDRQGIDRYVGLGDDPAALRLVEEAGRLRVEDEQTHSVRPVRDFRQYVGRLRDGLSRPDPRRDERLRQYIDLLEPDAAAAGLFTRAKLKVVLRLLARTDPIQAAMLLFAEGLVDAAHAPVLADTVVCAEQARRARGILRDTERSLDELDQGRVRALVEALLA